MTTYQSGQLGITDAAGNITIIYPVTLAENIRTLKKSINIDGTENEEETTETASLGDILNNLGELSTLDVGHIISAETAINPTSDSTKMTYNKTAINKLYTSVFDLTSNLSLSDASNKDNSEAIASLQRQVETLTTAMKSMSAVEGGETTVVDFSEYLEDINDNITTLSNKMDDVVDAISALISALNSGTSIDIGWGDNDDDSGNSGGNSGSGGYNDTINDPYDDGEVHYDEDDIRELERLVNNIRGYITEIDNTNYNFTNDIVYVQGNVNSADNTLATVNRNLNTLVTKVDEAQTSVDNLAGYNIDDDNRATINEAINYLSHLHEDLDNTSGSCLRVTNSMKDIKTRLSNITSLNDAYCTYMNQYTNVKANVIKATNDAISLMDKYVNDTTVTEAQIEAMEEKLQGYIDGFTVGGQTIDLFSELRDTKYDQNAAISDLDGEVSTISNATADSSRLLTEANTSLNRVNTLINNTTSGISSTIRTKVSDFTTKVKSIDTSKYNYTSLISACESSLSTLSGMVTNASTTANSKASDANALYNRANNLYTLDTDDVYRDEIDALVNDIKYVKDDTIITLQTLISGEESNVEDIRTTLENMTEVNYKYLAYVDVFNDIKSRSDITLSELQGISASTLTQGNNAERVSTLLTTLASYEESVEIPGYGTCNNIFDGMESSEFNQDTLYNTIGERIATSTQNIQYANAALTDVSSDLSTYTSNYQELLNTITYYYEHKDDVVDPEPEEPETPEEPTPDPEPESNEEDTEENEEP